MEIRVKTRNHGGVAAGMPLLLNFGLEYDHDSVKQAITESGAEAKKFKGMLDSYFTKMGAVAAAEADREGEQAAAAASASAVVAAVATTTTTSGNGGTEHGAASSTPAGVAGSSATAGSVGSSVVAGAAGSSPPATTGGTPAGVDSGAVSGVAAGAAAGGAVPHLTLATGEKRINDIMVKDLKLTLIMGPAGMRLASLQKLEGNKKVPPRTVLYSTNEGEIAQGEGANGIKFEYEKTKLGYACEWNKPLMTLHEMITKTGAKSLVKHAPWTGTAPSTVQLVSLVRFIPKLHGDLWAVAGGPKADGVGIAWSLKFSDQKKSLAPTGIVLYTTKQLILPAGGSIALQQ